jgi:hypothetical protein
MKTFIFCSDDLKRLKYLKKKQQQLTIFQKNKKKTKQPLEQGSYDISKQHREGPIQF